MNITSTSARAVIPFCPNRFGIWKSRPLGWFLSLRTYVSPSDWTGRVQLTPVSEGVTGNGSNLAQGARPRHRLATHHQGGLSTGSFDHRQCRAGTSTTSISPGAGHARRGTGAASGSSHFAADQPDRRRCIREFLSVARDRRRRFPACFATTAGWRCSYQDSTLIRAECIDNCEAADVGEDRHRSPGDAAVTDRRWLQALPALLQGAVGKTCWRVGALLHLTGVQGSPELSLGYKTAILTGGYFLK